jgi:hypothetical protein
MAFDLGLLDVTAGEGMHVRNVELAPRGIHGFIQRNDVRRRLDTSIGEIAQAGSDASAQPFVALAPGAFKKD